MSSCSAKLKSSRLGKVLIFLIPLTELYLDSPRVIVRSDFWSMIPEVILGELAWVLVNRNFDL